MTQNIMGLDKREQYQLFKIISENIDILIKLLPDAPLLKYIKDGYNDNSAIIQVYSAWKNSN